MIPLLVALQLGLPIGGIPVGAGGGGGSVTLVQDRGDSGHGACNNGGTPSTSITCAFSSAPTHGNFVLGICYTYNTNCTISDNAGTDTYTAVALSLQGGSTGSINNNCVESADTHKVSCLWYSLNVMGSATLKATVAASSFIIIHEYEFSNVKTSGAFDQEIANSLDTSQSSVTATTGSTAQSNELVLMACSIENSTTTVTPGSGYTLGMNDLSVSTNVIAGFELYSLSNSAGAQNPNATVNPTLGSGFTCGVGTFEHI